MKCDMGHMTGHMVHVTCEMLQFFLIFFFLDVNCIIASFRIGRESQCLPYAGFFWIITLRKDVDIYHPKDIF